MVECTQNPTIPSNRKSWNSLPVYDHVNCHFESKLEALFTILNQPKEFNLKERFIKIEEIFEGDFYLELLYHLKLTHLPSNEREEGQTPEKQDCHSPKLLLRIWSLLDCTGSIVTIAQTLELTVEEVVELIRELHNTYSIDPLIARLRRYYQVNQRLRESHALSKQEEFLGKEPTSEPEDSTEYRRRRRLRRKPNDLLTTD